MSTASNIPMQQRVGIEPYYTFPDKKEMEEKITKLEHFKNSTAFGMLIGIHPALTIEKIIALNRVIPAIIEKLLNKECSDSELNEIINGVVARNLKNIAKPGCSNEDEYSPLAQTWLRTPLKIMLANAASTTFQSEMRSVPSNKAE